MQIFYSIAGISIRGEIPYKINMQKESIPFLSDPAQMQCSDVDVKLEFRRKPLPEIPLNEGVWKMNRLYCREDDSGKVYFFPSENEPPYACVTRRNGTVTIDYTEESIPYINYSHNLIDMLSLETLLLEHQGIVVHSSFIRWNGSGIIFSGSTGIGKSTQADLWTRYEQAECLNGDRTGLRKVDGKWIAYGLPYAGTSGIFRNESAKLTAIVILRQGKENTVMQMNPAEAFRCIYPEVMIHRWDEGFVTKAADYISDLLTNVPAYLLTCRPDRGAVDVLKEKLATHNRGNI